MTIQVDEGFDWSNVFNGTDTCCSKAMKEHNNSEYESESEASNYSEDTNEDFIKVQRAFMAEIIEVFSEVSFDTSDTSETLSFDCNNCALLEDKIVKLKTHNKDLVNEFINLKEAYDVLN